MQKTIFIKKILLPKRTLFQSLINDLMGQIGVLTGRKNKPSALTQKNRKDAAKLVIEGLYRCFCSQSQGIALAVPHNPGAYHKTDGTKINIGFKIIVSVIDAMEALGWVKRKTGHWTGEGTGITTELTASGKLLEEFEKIGLAWQAIELTTDLIRLRNYGEDPTFSMDTSVIHHVERRKRRAEQEVPDTPDTKVMVSHLKKINKHLNKQCICLCISNEMFKVLSRHMTYGQKKHLPRYMLFEKYPRYLDFSMVQLRRIFSRSSMEKGGRFYGAWWQFIPKEYRKHITINLLPTVEVDYSGLHPMMIYHLDGLTPPEGDMYDIGIWRSTKERDQKRPIVKKFFNAIVNDEFGLYKMTPEDKKILGLSNSEVRAKISQRHPQISHRFNSGYGLTLQYEDSKIAERVMLLLAEQNICCLPVHDSFIVQYANQKVLITAMDNAYKERFGVEIGHKTEFLYAVDEASNPIHERGMVFPTRKPESNENWVQMDQDELFRMHGSSIYNQYCRAWLAAMRDK